MAQETGFAETAGPLRREILGHCYRMLGSAADAEDAVQETYLRAWRGYDRFEGRSSVRTWLHQVATNVCLRSLEQRSRRALPAGLGPPETDWTSRARPAPAETQWLGPLPGSPDDPADLAGTRQNVRLAFAAALQHLPVKQRAALILRDVAELPANEVAAILETTTVAVNSALLRARERLSREDLQLADMREPVAADLRTRMLRYAEAFERADVGALAAILHEDVTLEMPPHATWFAGAGPVLGFLGTHVLRRPSHFSVRPVSPPANGQPTFAMYAREASGEFVPHALHVLDVHADGIRRIHIFLQPELFPMFGQPVNPATEPDLHS